MYKDDYQKYCMILGVLPGDNAITVQQSFRELIKKHHPDSAHTEGDKKQAQLIIEAYKALKNGVPKNSTTDHILKNKNGPYKYQSTKANTSSHEKGAFSGKRMFRNVFSDASPHSKIHNFFRDLESENSLYPENETDTVWEYTSKEYTSKEYTPKEYSNSSRVNTRQYEKYSDNTWRTEMEDFEKLSSNERFKSVETILEKTVKTFEHQEGRFRKRWGHEFIGQLAQIQVLYRDLCQFSPAFTYKSLHRIRQISELITEIRKYC